MKAWILFTVALLLLWTSETLAAPNAHFTARKIQGSTCVAPCAVHCDAIGTGQDETTDPVFTREFHSLHFLWTFGDPGKGAWPNSGVDKNTAMGGIAGHLYDTPGTYTVTLTVVNPSGESSTFTESVVVTAPDSHFTAADTFCFANDGNDWSGCPLDCASGNDNCTVISDWVQAISQGDNCVGQSDCADADAQPRRILLRRGDTFTAGTQTIFSQTGAPALIAPFGTGADPLIVGQGRNDWGSGWTVTGIDLQSGQTILLGSAIDNVTFYSVDATFGQDCILEWSSSSSGGFGRLHAFIDVNCNGTGDTAYASWPGADYALWMGGTFDKNGGTASTLRAIHMQHYLIQHTRWVDAAPGREHWQFRTSEEVAGLSDEEEAARFVLLSDNVIENPASNSFFSVRTCVDSGCNCSEGSPDCGGAGIGAGEIVDLGDFHHRSTPMVAPAERLPVVGAAMRAEATRVEAHRETEARAPGPGAARRRPAAAIRAVTIPDALRPWSPGFDRARSSSSVCSCSASRACGGAVRDDSSRCCQSRETVTASRAQPGPHVGKTRPARWRGIAHHLRSIAGFLRGTNAALPKA